MQVLNYAVIVWATDADIAEGVGAVYGWYESIGTAVNTATDLMKRHGYAKAVAVKAL